MPVIDVYNLNKDKVGEIELSDNVFAAPVNEHLFYEVVRMQLAKKHTGNHSCKGRSEVRGGGAKPFRQKGTGRARRGTSRSPLLVGGGVTFGPHPRDYSYNVPKKVKRNALISALSQKFQMNKLYVVENLNLDKIKTKVLVGVLNKFETQKPILVDSKDNSNLYLSARNIPKVKTLPVAGLNVRDILGSDMLIATKESVEQLNELLSKKSG